MKEAFHHVLRLFRLDFILLFLGMNLLLYRPISGPQKGFTNFSLSLDPQQREFDGPISLTV